MANRIVDNTYIIDTASANVPIPVGSGIRIRSILLWGANTTATAIFTGADTTNVLARLSIGDAGTNGGNAGYNFGDTNWSNLKVPTLTAGTAFIQLG